MIMKQKQSTTIPTVRDQLKKGILRVPSKSYFPHTVSYLAEIDSIGFCSHRHLLGRAGEVHDAGVEVLAVVLQLPNGVSAGIHRDENRL